MLHIENQPTTSLYPGSDLLAAAMGRFPKLCYLIIVRERQMYKYIVQQRRIANWDVIKLRYSQPYVFWEW